MTRAATLKRLALLATLALAALPDRAHAAGSLTIGMQLGRDVLSLVMAGAKNSVGVALLSVSESRISFGSVSR